MSAPRERVMFWRQVLDGREDLDEQLFGDPRGWALKPVVVWLLQAGRRIAHAGRLLDALARQLLDVGAPLSRIQLICPTIHPLVAAWAFVWRRDRGTTKETGAPHGLEDLHAHLGWPVQEALLTAQISRERIDHADAAAHPNLQVLAQEGIVEAVTVPLVFTDDQLNLLIYFTSNREGFSEGDLSKFAALANYLTPILEVISKRRMAKVLLETYVGRRSGKRVLHGQIKRGDTEKIRAAIWFSDLRDFTRMTESLTPDRLLSMLNAYFEFITAAVTARGGEVLRFIGDAVLIIFPIERGTEAKAACAAALDAAIDAFNSLATLNLRLRRLGESSIRFGVALHVGEVVYGNVGAPDRLDFTVMGAAVNRTARLEDLTKALGVPLLLSSEFASMIDVPVIHLGQHRVRGVAEPQDVYCLKKFDYGVGYTP